MRRDVIEIPSLSSSFLSVEKDIERILTKLFFENQPQNRQLLRLLVIPTRDCLSNQTKQEYIDKVRSTTLATLIEEGYIKLAPKIAMPEHEKIKSYIIISFDNFTPNARNPQFRDCTVHFDIVCHTDYWTMDDFQIRPLKIAGYIDGILNETKLSGIGTLQFISGNELLLNGELNGYCLIYKATHGADDLIPEEE